MNKYLFTVTTEDMGHSNSIVVLGEVACGSNIPLNIICGCLRRNFYTSCKLRIPGEQYVRIGEDYA